MGVGFFTRIKHLRRVTLVVFAGLFLAACGPLGGEDSDDPTETAESIPQPTIAETIEIDEIATGDVDVIVVETEPVAGASPQTALTAQSESTTDVVAAATPSTTDVSSASPTPVVGDSSVVSPSGAALGTPLPSAPVQNSDETDSADFGGSDGTSGATPGTEIGNSDVAGGTPFVVEEEPTSAPGASSPAPPDASLEDLQPVTVSGCEPDTVLPASIDQVTYITAVDVNFRTGPGVDCDLIGSGPVGINFSVTLLGGPVEREDDDFVWVQVEIAGETGWVVAEALAPAG